MENARERAINVRPLFSRDSSPQPLGFSPRQSVQIRVNDSSPSLDRRISAFCKASWSWLFSAGVHAFATLVLMVCTTSRDLAEPEFVYFSETRELESEIAQPMSLAEASFASVVPPMPAGRVGESATSLAMDMSAPTINPPGLAVGRAGGDESTRSGGPIAAARTLVERNDQLFGDVVHQAQGTRFFGIEATGNRFVFVVDSSSSMKWAKWRRACGELVASVESLGPNQSFCVLFFDSAPHLMFNQRPAELRLIPASPGNITRLRRWMASVTFGDDTRPFAAIRHALALRPDAVFLLSDGEFHDGTLAYFRTIGFARMEDKSSRPVAVHTIGFESQLGQATLRQIADQTGGVYRFVP